MKSALVSCIIAIIAIGFLASCGAGEGQQPQGAYDLPEFPRPDIPEERDKLRRQPGMVPEGQTGQGTNTREDNITYHEQYEGQIVTLLTSRIKALNHVEDARVIVRERTVLVGVIPKEGTETAELEQAVEREVLEEIGYQDLRIVTDNEGFEEIRKFDDELRRGRAFEEVSPQNRNLWRDFGRILQRPFEHNRPLNIE